MIAPPQFCMFNKSVLIFPIQGLLNLWLQNIRPMASWHYSFLSASIVVTWLVSPMRLVSSLAVVN